MPDPLDPTFLQRFVEAGTAAWPALSIDVDAFARHVETLAPPLAYAGDVLLSYACAAQKTGAIRALDALLRVEVAAAVAKVDPSPSFADDVAQDVREQLLLSTPPTIGTYAGRASLRTWLRTVALRTALNLRRRIEDRAGAREEVNSSFAAPANDEDLAYLRAQCGEHFAGALREAIARLPERDRQMLHLHLAERVTLEKLAAMHSVSTSTASRWVTAARERLALDVRDTVRARLKITSSEYDGLAPLLRSEIDVSLAGLLGDSPALGDKD
ncbi:MAG TPA: sigma-70 family RNA polymerase sigma factor [Polyangiaceae bacterium]|jgi:RNA polymerase sigma-70 factor (ECF subfamily)